MVPLLKSATMYYTERCLLLRTLYCMSLIIFCERAAYRQLWLHIAPMPEDVKTNWLKLAAKKLGLMWCWKIGFQCFLYFTCFISTFVDVFIICSIIRSSTHLSVLHQAMAWSWPILYYLFWIYNLSDNRMLRRNKGAYGKGLRFFCFIWNWHVGVVESHLILILLWAEDNTWNKSGRESRTLSRNHTDGQKCFYSLMCIFQE